MDHDHEIGHLATSTDLLTWTHQAVIDEPATQPTLAATGDGGLLTAAQCHHGHGGRDHRRDLGRDDDLVEAQGAGATSRPGGSTSTTGRPGPPNGHDHRASTAFANPTATVLCDPPAATRSW